MNNDKTMTRGKAALEFIQEAGEADAKRTSALKSAEEMLKPILALYGWYRPGQSTRQITDITANAQYVAVRYDFYDGDEYVENVPLSVVHAEDPLAEKTRLEVENQSKADRRLLDVRRRQLAAMQNEVDLLAQQVEGKTA